MFIRNVENFICEQCGAPVTGTGYTDHCPCCLWSKHVDVDPGDRAATCGGMMRPTGITGIADHYMIQYRCETCGYTKQNKVQNEDDHDAIIRVAQMRADDWAGYERPVVQAEADAVCENPDHDLLEHDTTPDSDLMTHMEKEVEEGEYHAPSFDTNADGKKIVEDYS